MIKKSLASRMITAVAAMAALIGGYYLGNMNKDLIKEKPQIASHFDQPRQLKPFTMRTENDPLFNNEDLLGHWTFLYFGYTFCPDICPTTLMQLAQMRNRISAEKELLDKSQFVMISVDPARDNTERLNAYVTHFNPKFIGATGERDQIDSISDDLGIYYKLHEPDENGNYPVDHTSAVILINPKGELEAIYSAIHNPKTAASDFLLIAGQYD